VLGLLRELVDRRRLTLIMVTHDAGHAARADRCLRLLDGRLVEQVHSHPGRSRREAA
jgi:predicted ABC-type transport system involved in lysophospholipase L1 biosynthesis ATPase subunit